MAPPSGDEPGDTPSVEVEAVDPVDIGEVVELWVDLAAGQRAHGSHVRPEPNRESVRDTLARHAVAGGVLAARRGDEIVGFVSFGPERGAYDSDVTRGIVHNLYVTPEVRGHGVGGDLLAAAEDALIDTGASVVALEAMAANDSARRFYRRQGYAAHRVEFEKPIGPEGDTDAGAAAAESDTHSKEG